MLLAPPQRDIQNQGDQMRLGLVRLAIAFDRAGHVEVAQARIAKAVDAVQPGQHLLHQQLALAIGIGRSRLASSVIGVLSGSP